MEEFMELLTKDYNTMRQLKSLMNAVKDMECHTFDYGRSPERISLRNIMNNTYLPNYEFLSVVKNETNPIINLLHKLFLEKWEDIYSTNHRDNFSNPLSTHMKFLLEIYNILKKQLENTEEYKLRMEQQRKKEEEERARLVMEQEKKLQEEKKKNTEYFLRQQAIKTKKVPCPNCGKLIAWGNHSTHKTKKVCINFGKEIEVREKGYFICECGKRESNTNRQNHLATQKCMRKRGLIE
jgi:predicted RNA-binding Zn-ribbon protein involved in translation (DUF1610 family)